MARLRLHQFLSKSGMFKDKGEVIRAIRFGKIKIKGDVIKDINYRIDPKENNGYYNDKLMKLAKKVYFLFNKPKRVNCQKGEKKSIYNTINAWNLDEETKRSLFTVGRLDVDSSGLIIITNDGMLASKISDPKNKIRKTYQVTIDREIRNDDIEKLKHGVVIDLEDKKYKTWPAKVQKIGSRELLVTIKEGKKRQIRRMFGALHYTVKELKRISIENLKLGHLGLKERKEMSKDEIYDALFKN